MKRFLVLFLLLALPVMAGDEVESNTAAATTVSQTITFTDPATAVVVCSQGANVAYYRLFTDYTSPAVATSADVRLPAGSAIAPYCHSYSFDKSLSGTGYQHISVVSAGTTTVDIVSQ